MSQSQSQSQSETQTQTNQLNHNSLKPQTDPNINSHSTQSHPTVPSQAPHSSALSQTHNSTIDANKDRKARNYKLIADPALKKGPIKIYRYDGVVPGVSFISFDIIIFRLKTKVIKIVFLSKEGNDLSFSSGEGPPKRTSYMEPFRGRGINCS